MTDHAALVRAVCEHPDDDTPRLVFADLLEEEGDHTRAHFVRTQVELARVPEWDPLWAKCRQLEPWVFRGWTMAGALPKPLPTGFDWRAYRFRRGFPWLAWAQSGEDVMARADGLFDRAPVQALSFDDRSQPNPATLADTPHLTRLRRLEFTLTRFDADDLAPLGNSPHAGGLTELVFERDAITADGLEALAGSPLFGRLEVLKLSLTGGMAPALLVDALAAAADPQLRKLVLPCADLPAPDAATLFALPVAGGLDHLDLTDNPLGPDGVAAVAEARNLRGVRVLKLGKTRAGAAGAAALAASGVVAGVRWLDLSANRLGPVAVRKLAESRHARGLRLLDLGDNPVGDAGAAALAASPHLAGLVELDLADAGVGAAGMIALADSPYLDNLVRLDLRNQRAGRPPGAEVRRALLDRFGPRVSFNQ